jgi:hypothetical protein
LQITHNDTPQSVGLFWTRDRPVAETKRQHTTLKTDIHAPSGIRTSNATKRAVVDLTLDRSTTGASYLESLITETISHIAILSKKDDKRNMAAELEFDVVFSQVFLVCRLAAPNISV